MTDISDIDVIAYVDGCLNDQARPAFEARLRDDPALAERVEAHRWMTRQIVSAYGPPPGDAVDSGLIARLGLAGNTVVAFTGQGGRPRRHVFAAVMSGVIAASLALGLFVGRWLERAPAPWLQGGPQAQVLADGALAESLSGNLTGQAGPVRIGMSFRTRQGLCRTFSTGTGLSGIGCRQGERWVVPVVVTGAASTSTGDYRLAAGDVAPAVMAEVDRRIIGDPFDASAEKASVEKGWKN
ncbi:hypothetical protein OLX02_13290 [Novosphingobium sp. KCTC 2891]|uniref:hypothetical protein n=1 Tax=Novosphingobium sp. KCTC 2891 TaxID=2989730 RepID=UPI0022231839|nr:hypothetical protein [Novosphingobium sp. KCTC 2891]MCW1383797.1 hypothetical protein [Novosphingobium sp. KCTC 2891]